MFRVTDPWNSPILARLAEWRKAREDKAAREAVAEARADMAKVARGLYRPASRVTPYEIGY